MYELSFLTFSSKKFFSPHIYIYVRIKSERLQLWGHVKKQSSLWTKERELLFMIFLKKINLLGIKEMSVSGNSISQSISRPIIIYKLYIPNCFFKNINILSIFCSWLNAIMSPLMAWITIWESVQWLCLIPAARNNQDRFLNHKSFCYQN